MAVYWLTFRLDHDANYAQRYDDLVEAVRRIASRWWTESTSFLLFESSKDIDGVAASVKASIKPAVDIALVGMPEFKSARAIGATKDQDLFNLIPFTKKV